MEKIKLKIKLEVESSNTKMKTNSRVTFERRVWLSSAVRFDLLIYTASGLPNS